MSKIDKFSSLLLTGEKKTLVDETSEVNAKIYIKAKESLEVVNVDHKLIGEKQGNKKCDFVVLGVNTNKTHMIELKGANIDAAFKQISSTIDYFYDDLELNKYVKLRETLDAYIASPERQRVPEIHSKDEKELVKKLAVRSKCKPADIFKLVHFVKVVKKQKRAVINGRQVIISGQAPLELD